MNLDIATLSKSHDRKSFHCAADEVDLFLKHKAFQDQTLDLSRTYILTDSESDPSKIIGYFTITPIHISQNVVLNDKPKIKRELPALLLGQLGVAVEYQKKGFGELLLLNAESKALMASDIVGLRTVVLDARNEQLVKWYSSYGFSRVGSAL